MTSLLQLASQQWRRFVASYDRDEIVAKSSPLTVVGAVGAAYVVIGVALVVEHLSPEHQFRHHWLPSLLILSAAAASLTFWKLGGRGRLAPVLTLYDTAALIAAAALCVAFTTSPVSYCFAVFLGGMLVSSQSRDFSLTWVYAATLLLFGVGLTWLLTEDYLAAFLVAGSCAFGLFCSHSTGVQRRLQRKADGLESALESSEELAKKSMELALSTTLLDIGSFFHELCNMQAAVHLNLSVLREELKESPSQTLLEAIAAHEKEREILQEAMENLRRESQAHRATFDLREVLQRDAFAKLTLAPEVVICGQVPQFLVKSDAKGFQLILKNLLRNASQAGATRVEISCELSPDASSVCLCVQDDGEGLPDVCSRDLFEPFASYGKSEGTGLGLYLTQRSVELMGGQITAGNAERGGAQFKIRLPGRLKSLGEAREATRADRE